jgi:hypothetical protein
MPDEIVEEIGVPDEEVDEPLRPELHVKTAKEIREKIDLEVSFDRTFIVVVAIHNDPEKNSLTRIHCRKGLPISGYLYDGQTDSYHVECHDFLPLGYIPVSFHHSMPGVGNWKQRIPMPETAIRRYLTAQQKRDLRNFKATYKGGNYSYHYMQVIDCY